MKSNCFFAYSGHKCHNFLYTGKQINKQFYWFSLVSNIMVVFMNFEKVV